MLIAAKALRNLLPLLLLGFLCACATPGGAELRSADSDSDGIPDAMDQCKETASPQPVDFEGCPVIGGALKNVDFAANASDLGRDSRAALDDFVILLNQHPSVVVAVAGHTDNRGSGIRNLELSKQRVMAVVRYLVARGIAPGRLQPYGYGEARPVVSNASAEGRAQNRRIEVSVVVPQGTPNAGAVAQSR